MTDATSESATENIVFRGFKGETIIPILPQISSSKSASIPVIDLGDLHSEDEVALKNLVKEIYQALSTYGIFYVCNHGIDQETLSIGNLLKKFFALLHEQKMNVHRSFSLDGMRGYEFFLQGKDCVPFKTDLPQLFEMMATPEDKKSEMFAENLEEIHIPNIWPASPPDLKLALWQYVKTMRTFSLRLFRIIALGLEMDEDYFENIYNPYSGLACLWYPVCKAGEKPGKGLHTDFSLFTILNQLTPHPGLEILNADGHYVSIPPISNTLVVNAGDFLERITGGRFRSVPHRVVNKDSENRLSIAYFADAHPEAWIVPVTATTTQGFRAGEWCKNLESQPSYLNTK